MTQKGKSVTLTLYSSPEGRYHWGGGCPYGQPLWGVKVQRLWCPGSEGSESSACLWQAGSKGGGIALRAMSFIARLAGTGLHWRPPPSTTSWSPYPRKRWEARLKGVVSLPPRREACHWILSRLQVPYESSSLATVSGGKQGLRAQSSPPCYLPTPFPGVGGERSETEGGGCTFFTLLSFLLWFFRFLCRLL